METIKVLDNGYIALIESWGSDERIIEAARMSTGKGFLGWETDEKLLKFLWVNKHSTPFEMAGATFEIQAPIFVFREWHRHRTQSYNEFSARYSVLPNISYIPSVERLIESGKLSANKQATGSKEVTESQAEIIQQVMKDTYERNRLIYERLLAQGISKEVARIIIPVGQYSKMRASANLLNWTKFLRLRCADNAQYEIRQYALALKDILRELFPRTISLFEGEK